MGFCCGFDMISHFNMSIIENPYGVYIIKAFNKTSGFFKRHEKCCSRKQIGVARILCNDGNGTVIITRHQGVWIDDMVVIGSLDSVIALIVARGNN